MAQFGLYFQWMCKYALLQPPIDGMIGANEEVDLVKVDIKGEPLCICDNGLKYNYCIRIRREEEKYTISSYFYYGKSLSPHYIRDKRLEKPNDGVIPLLQTTNVVSALYCMVKKGILDTSDGILTKEDCNENYAPWKEVRCFFRTDALLPQSNMLSVSMKELLQQYGEYSSIQKYFHGINVVDMLDIPLKNALEMVEPEHKFLTTKLWKEHIIPLVSGPSNRIRGAELVRALAKRLNDNHILISSQLTSVASQDTSEQITLQNIVMAVESATKATKQLLLANRTEISIDCQDNWILEEDLLYATLFSSALGGKDMVKSFDLSWNQVGYGEGTEESILEAIKGLCAQCQQVLLIGNPIAANSWKGMWQRMGPEVLSQVIWLTRSAYNGTSWKVMVKEDLFDLVNDLHRAYYSVD